MRTSLAAYFIVMLALNLLVQQAGFRSLLEVGYGDSYILYDILNLEKTGIIYRNLANPPYLPAQYSPLVYLTYSLSRFIPASNIFFGPRLIAFTFFLLCAAMVVSIARKLIPFRFVWIWALLVVASIGHMDDWILQLRGDFLGILFGLAAIRLLMSRYRHSALAAGLCAGLAIQVKLTLVAAAASGFVWLLMQKRWKDTAIFTIATIAASAGLFYAYWLREPAMLVQMTALFPGIKDLRGCFRLFGMAFSETVVLLSLMSLPFLFSGGWSRLLRRPKWLLLLVYLTAAAGFGFVADIQAGGNVNYFFEALLAATPLALVGMIRLFSWSDRHRFALLLVPCLLLFHLAVFDRKSLSRSRDDFSLPLIGEHNDRFAHLETALRDRRVLSLEPRFALLDPRPPIMEPYLLSYLRRQGHFDPAPLIEIISSAKFDIFIWGSPAELEYRGLRKFEGNDLEKAVSDAYTPFCRILNISVGFPKSRPVDDKLVQDVKNAGCVVTTPASPPL